MVFNIAVQTAGTQRYSAGEWAADKRFSSLLFLRRLLLQPQALGS